jgi:hypothetical protein
LQQSIACVHSKQLCTELKCFLAMNFTQPAAPLHSQLIWAHLKQLWRYNSCNCTRVMQRCTIAELEHFPAQSHNAHTQQLGYLHPSHHPELRHTHMRMSRVPLYPVYCKKALLPALLKLLQSSTVACMQVLPWCLRTTPRCTADTPVNLIYQGPATPSLKGTERPQLLRQQRLQSSTATGLSI